MTDRLRAAAQAALEALLEADPLGRAGAIAQLRAALAEPEAEPEEWKPIGHPYNMVDVLDIRFADGSVLCGVIPQFDGDFWWKGEGTGEKFIDPEYSSVTHWRISVG